LCGDNGDGVNGAGWVCEIDTEALNQAGKDEGSLRQCEMGAHADARSNSKRQICELCGRRDCGHKTIRVEGVRFAPNAAMPVQDKGADDGDVAAFDGMSSNGVWFTGGTHDDKRWRVEPHRLIDNRPGSVPGK
jgi:hypothetical protein